jgi:hypothetical protein
MRYAYSGAVQTERDKAGLLSPLFPQTKSPRMSSTVLVVIDIKPDKLTVTGLSLLKEAIHSFGYSAVVARDCSDALRILQDSKIDAVLCTLGLYEATAFDLLADAKAANLASMPFIVVTVSQTPIHDKLIGLGCEATGAIYFNMGNYDSTEEMREELKKRLLVPC